MAHPTPDDACSICAVHLPKAEPGQYKTILRISGKAVCEKCYELNHCPMCLACGERVRDAKRTDPEPYHDHCRRCSSCHQIIPKHDMHKLAGKLLCSSCSSLFGHFFVPDRRPESEHLKESFVAWDTDGSGFIEQGELGRVLKALDPNFADTDIHKLVRTIDKNGDGLIDFAEFCDWVMQGDPLEMQEDSFEAFVNQLMREAGRAARQSKMGVAEVHVRPDGLMMLLRGGDKRFETQAITSANLELAVLNPEEFIDKIECTEKGLIIDTNTGRIANVPCKGDTWGPWVAPDGFHIVGIRTKLDGDGTAYGKKERIVGVDVAPLPNAKCYDPNAALRFASEHEFLSTLRGLLSKGAINLDSFSPGPGGVTALMLAAQYGNVGAMRMLLGSKATVNLTDADGWTALAFASRHGQTGCVSILLDKGATQEGDNGNALQQALNSQHNSAARALLRAGFGPAANGFFALEESNTAVGSLSTPNVTPPPAAYSGPVTVSMECEKGAVMKFTLDGRDPLTAGRRYKGPIYLAQPRNHLRAVCVKGKQHSPVFDALYVVCHYAMPHEVVKGSMVIRTFPQAMDMVKKAMSNVLGFPKERVLIEKDDTENPDKYWLTVCLRDPLPRHRLTIDRPYTLVRGDKQKSQFIDNFKKDVHRAVTGDPTGVEISAGSGDHSGIIVNFTLEREFAEELGRQLTDSSSYLVTKAKSKAHFREARLSVVESLGDRLSMHDVREALRESFSRKAVVCELLCMGSGDTGVISTLTPKGDVKILRKGYEKCIKDVLPDCVQEGFTETPEDIELTYTIDVVASVRGPKKIDGGVVVKDINADKTGVCFKVEQELFDMGLPVSIKLGNKATSRPLQKIEFRVRWDPPRATGKEEKVIQDFLSGACFVYAENRLAQVVDFVLGGEDRVDTETLPSSSSLGLSVCRAMTSGGEDVHDPSLVLDLSALPHEATDMFITLAAFETERLNLFPNATVEIYDYDAKRKLTSYTLPGNLDGKAVVACSISRPDGAWVVQGLCLQCEGNMRHYDPIHDVISLRQDDYLRWDRRQHLVKLRVMHKTGRITEGSTNEFAQFMWRVIKLPIPLFQLVVRWL